MRTTIDIPESLMSDVLSLAKTRKKKDAVRLALEEFVKRRKIEQLLNLPGKIDILDISGELEELEVGESKSTD